MRHWRSQGRALKGVRGLGIALCGLLLSVCQRGIAAPASPLPVLPRECSTLDSAHPLNLPLTAPADGMLRVMVEERGISTVSFLHDPVMTGGPLPAEPADAAASPIDRLGTVVLTRDMHRSEHVAVEVRVDDSHDVSGRVCVSAILIAPTDSRWINAERDLDAAGRASHATDWDTAFSLYLKAARAFDALGLRPSSAMARHSMAELAYWRFDRKRDAYALASEALADYGTFGEPLLIGSLGELEAEALMDMPGNNSAAVAPLVRQWLSVARKYDSADPYGARELPRVDILTGFLEFLLNAVDDSRQAFAVAARSCHELRDWDCYAMASNNLAQLAEHGKDYSVALSDYADGLRLLPVELDPKLAATIWNNLGRLQGVVGLFNASERSLTAAMQTYARLGDCQGVRRSLVRTGNLLVQLGNLADAQSDLARAASFDCPNLLASAATRPNEKSSDPALVVDGVRRDSGETTHAALEHPCAQSLDPGPLTRESNIIVFNSLLALSNSATLEGDHAEVWRCLNAAQRYSTDARNQVRLANARGNAFLERNDAKDAHDAFASGIGISDDAGLPTTFEDRRVAQLGLVKSMLLAGEAARSLDSAFQALMLSTARGDIESTITSLRLIAAGYRGSGQTAKAEHVLQVAADLIEAVPIDELNGEQRATYLASQHRVFAELTDLFASQGDSDNQSTWLAFEASERGRARSLRYALNQETRNASAPTAAPPAAKYQRLLSDFIRVTEDTTANQSPSTLIDEIEHLTQGGGSSSSLLDRTQLRRTLKQLGATLVEYASGTTEMLAFVISEDHVQIVRLGDSREIARATAELRDRLRDAEAPASEVREAARAVARLVLWPVTPYLHDNRAVVVPDDALNTIPLAVLPWADDPNQQLLLQHAETSVIPSALFLMQVHPGASTKSETPRIALIGDPVFRVADWRRECIETDTAARSGARSVSRTLTAWTESLPRLPGTRSEVTSIARLAHESHPGSRVETLVGCAAVPSALRRAAGTDVDLLHIATHARIDAQRPRLSALALTPESPQDGPASTFGLLDILGLKLNSKLVVLSACETSRGRLLPGEGVLGPAQAFLQAGSAAVLASYWRVDDQVTSAFMQRFYKYLLVDRLSASAALRKTQLESAATGKSYEWAAFSLYGWPDSSI